MTSLDEHLGSQPAVLAARAGLAGVAVTGTPEALVCFERAGALADRHGLFLAIPGEQP